MASYLENLPQQSLERKFPAWTWNTAYTVFLEFSRIISVLSDLLIAVLQIPGWPNSLQGDTVLLFRRYTTKQSSINWIQLRVLDSGKKKILVNLQLQKLQG